MLQFMRDYAKSWVIKIVLWTVVASFVGTIFLVWGMGRDVSEGVVATVEGKKITFGEYQQIYNKVYDFYKRQQGDIKEDIFAPIIKKTALDTIVARKLQLSLAKQEGIMVTDEEVVDEIQGTDIFKKDGRFDRDMYIRILHANKMNPGEYEDGVREDLLIRKMESFIKDGVKVSKKDVRDAYIRLNEKVDADYLILTPDNFINNVPVSQDKIEEFYNNNKSLFQRGEEIVADYISADPKNYEKDIQIDEARINEYYDGHIAEYKLPKRIKARHILISVPPDAGDAAEVEARAKALKALQELKDGGDFAETAKKYSDDPNKAAGGDLGFFPRGQMIKPFEDAAFALKEGELSEPVRTQFGFHIIKVEKIEAERTKPLQEVREDIVKRLKEDESKKKAKAEMEGISQKPEVRSQKPEFKEVIKGHSYLIVSMGSFKKDDREHPVLSRASFALKKGELSDVVEDGKKFYILRYKDKKDAFIPKLEEIRGEVEKAYRNEEAKKIADLEAGKILEDLKKGKETTPSSPPSKGGDRGGKNIFYKIANEFKVEIKNTGYANRNTIASIMGRDEELIYTVFNTQKGSYGKTRLGDRYYILYIKDIAGIDEEKLKKEEDDFAKRLLIEKQNYTYQQWLENAKKRAEEKGRIKIAKGFM
ncbi:MAG: SurA N-terminal domain-containing protein [Nitrospinae bacterium]|nr:SurA N-terminal domain-containing protein [Nitrospinota bacterium]